MRRAGRTLIAAALAAALAACERQAPEPAPSTAADAVPENAPGIALGDARVQLPAVPGRPGVAYFTVSQANGAARSLVAVHVAGAGRAEMHRTAQQGATTTMAPVGPVPLGPGRTVAFAPGGYHVMLFDLDRRLAEGRQTELTVTFDNGDKASVAARIVAAGAAMEHAH